jgi:hypothetical protein
MFVLIITSAEYTCCLLLPHDHFDIIIQKHLMKQTFTNNQLLPFLKSILTLLLLSGTVAALHAQPNMNANGLFYRIEYDGDGYVDLTIPNAPGQELFFVLNGGDGGRRVVPDLCKVKGGEGATVQAAFAVGTGPGRLNPGGVIRFIPGQRGESNTGGGINGGGGGGGTGILYKAPGANITCDCPFPEPGGCILLLGFVGRSRWRRRRLFWRALRW